MIIYNCNILFSRSRLGILLKTYFRIVHFEHILNKIRGQVVKQQHYLKMYVTNHDFSHWVTSRKLQLQAKVSKNYKLLVNYKLIQNTFMRKNHDLSL